MNQQKPKTTPAGYHTMTPHIVVRGAARAADWYKQAFGAVETARVPVPGGKLMSVELWFGDSPIRLADEFVELNVISPQTLGGTPITLSIFSDDVDALWKKAIDAGAQVFHPLNDAFWGDRHGVLIDPFGHRWGLAQHMRDVPQDEIEQAAIKAFSGISAQ
jgi:PhnB protein